MKLVYEHKKPGRRARIKLVSGDLEIITLRSGESIQIKSIVRIVKEISIERGVPLSNISLRFVEE